MNHIMITNIKNKFINHIIHNIHFIFPKIEILFIPYIYLYNNIIFSIKINHN